MAEKNYNFYRIFKNHNFYFCKMLKNVDFFCKINFYMFTKFVKAQKGYKNTFFLKKIFLKESFLSINYNHNILNTLLNCTKFFTDTNKNNMFNIFSYTANI